MSGAVEASKTSQPPKESNVLVDGAQGSLSGSIHKANKEAETAEKEFASKKELLKIRKRYDTAVQVFRISLFYLIIYCASIRLYDVLVLWIKAHYNLPVE